MDFYVTAMFELAVELFFHLRARFRKKPAVVGRLSVPQVTPR